MVNPSPHLRQPPLKLNRGLNNIMTLLFNPTACSQPVGLAFEAGLALVAGLWHNAGQAP